MSRWRLFANLTIWQVKQVGSTCHLWSGKTFAKKLNEKVKLPSMDRDLKLSPKFTLPGRGMLGVYAWWLSCLNEVYSEPGTNRRSRLPGWRSRPSRRPARTAGRQIERRKRERKTCTCRRRTGCKRLFEIIAHRRKSGVKQNWKNKAPYSAALSHLTKHPKYQILD